jgi:hypothetical protein
MQENAVAKCPTDPNQLAKRIIGIATGQETDTDEPKKDPAAAALGRRGGVKGAAKHALKAFLRKNGRKSTKMLLQGGGK